MREITNWISYQESSSQLFLGDFVFSEQGPFELDTLPGPRVYVTFDLFDRELLWLI